jgi:Short C-terminal domain
VDSSQVCPRCGTALNSGFVVCPKCGLNTATGALTAAPLGPSAVKWSTIVIFSIIAGYVLATFLSVALVLVGINIPASLAKSSSEYNTYGGVEILITTIGLSWAMYQVLARGFLETKAPKPTSSVSSPVSTALERWPQAPLAYTPSLAQPAFIGSVSSPVAREGQSQAPASTNAGRTAVRRGQARRARLTPLLLAVGVALAWGILSVGPAKLADDLVWVVPHDDVWSHALTDGRCPLDDLVVEGDGMCHSRWGGNASFLIGDVFRGAENGLLAFLAVGAAILLLPRLRAAMLESSPGAAELQQSGTDGGTRNQPTVSLGETVGDKLRQLAALRDDGIISAEEFETKKAELLRSF